MSDVQRISSRGRRQRQRSHGFISTMDDPLLLSMPASLGEEARRGYVPPERRASWIQVCLILFAELVGTGALGLPYTFAKVGYGIGIALLLVFMMLSVYFVGPYNCQNIRVDEQLHRPWDFQHSFF